MPLPLSGSARACAGVVATLALAACAPRTRPPLGDSPISSFFTGPSISANDLRHRVELFAADSMEGRWGRGADRATAYLVAELRRLGFEPAGDSGTFLQNIPYAQRTVHPGSVLIAGDDTLRWGTDFIVNTPRSISVTDLIDVPVIVGGRFPETPETRLPPEDFQGKLVLFSPTSGQPGRPPHPRQLYPNPRHAGVRGVIHVILDSMASTERVAALSPFNGLRSQPGSFSAPFVIHVTRSAAEKILGSSLSAARTGMAGRRLTTRIILDEKPIWSPGNVIARLPGTSREHRGQYVAIGAHADAQGTTGGGRDTAGSAIDSIYNGADDNASGAMALLEIAEAMAAARKRSPRSTLFIWHAAEERGLAGSMRFTDHPTIPRDSIVAYINLDMIGRGGATDIPGGGPAYLQIMGVDRASSELGPIVERVNGRQRIPFQLDRSRDAPKHEDRMFCRSDQAMFARYGIPVVYFTTGSHADYHKPSDEASRIDYEKLERITRFVRDLSSELGKPDQRLVRDRPAPDPRADCIQ